MWPPARDFAPFSARNLPRGPFCAGKGYYFRPERENVAACAGFRLISCSESAEGTILRGKRVLFPLGKEKCGRLRGISPHFLPGICRGGHSAREKGIIPARKGKNVAACAGFRPIFCPESAEGTILRGKRVLFPLGKGKCGRLRGKWPGNPP